MKNAKFNFEDLEVWQRGVRFCTDIIEFTEEIATDRKHYRFIEQLESSSASIFANIAEGKGRYSKKEFIQFLYIARGSLYETITFLTISHEKKWINTSRFEEIKLRGIEIGKMVSKLISSIKMIIN